VTLQLGTSPILLFGLELLRSPVSEKPAEAVLIAVAASALAHGPRFGPAPKSLHPQALVEELATQAPGGTIPQRPAGVYVRGFEAFLLQRSRRHLTDELGAVARAQVARRTVLADQKPQHFDHATRAQVALHVDHQRLKCLRSSLMTRHFRAWPLAQASNTTP
jgi:hypothetical protein